MEIFFFWILFSVFIGVGASSRGRNGFGWFVLAVVISPVLALILLALMPSLARPPVDLKSGLPIQPSAPTPYVSSDDLRKCPECAELIKREARKCKHCGSQVEPLHAQQKASEVTAGDDRLPPLGTKQQPEHYWECNACRTVNAAESMTCRKCDAAYRSA
jgi:hypothetical protein